MCPRYPRAESLQEHSDVVKSTWIAERSSFGRQALVFAALAMVSPAMTAPVVAQETTEKTVGERLKEYWDKMIAKTESGARAAGDEYHKLKDEAAKASGPAREKLSAEMEVLSKKWAIAREKLATTVELRMHSLGEEYKTLEEKASKATGPAREKMDAEMQKLHEQWIGRSGEDGSHAVLEPEVEPRGDRAP